ncbi:aminoglycoside phosphotransferase family protein [Blastococcus sp. TF02A-26]|uniref:aminoglycoside phosphotransferase family protein n=1 Tax=Blastococcus sp. TF02A-26 TaxID=2250577 RepID=UPI000DEAE240|nr:aminoglycoside phosphotransferase family protein [Blastococcus sp. TF02A-26]RBY88376.1 aminoglycoside phosphotransferase family protein [Blastococcus sp. TF02A-26]
MTGRLPADWPPSLRLLLGPAAGDAWAAVLAPLGGRLADLRAATVTLRADGSAAVRYVADVAWADGRATRESLAAATGSRIPSGAAVVEGPGDDGSTVAVGLWRWPSDPALPGLAWAASAARAAQRLAVLGVDAGPLRLRLRAYRPGRRAVVEATSPDGRWFLKVVRPAAAPALADRHRALAGAVPVPPVVATTEDGVLVLPALPGTPMRAALGGDPAALPPPEHLATVLDALPPLGGPAGRRDPTDPVPRTRAHATVVGLICPELRPRLGRVTTAVAAAVRPQPLVPVHGDFYEGQLLVDAGRVVGLLDVDTAGPGARIDDWATLLGHLALLELLASDPAPVATYRARVEAFLSARSAGDELRARVAGVLVGLATGPFRVQQANWAPATEARVALAEEWAGLR